MILQKLKFYLSLHFPIRYHLRKDIKYFAKKYDFEGRILDFGCGQKPYASFFYKSEYIGIDFQNFSKQNDNSREGPDYFFDENYEKTLKLPFENGSFDHTVSFQVLEHHRNPEIMISEITRVVKEEGYILITCPFIYALHEEPNDFQRFTEHQLKRLFKKNNCEIVEIKKQGSLFSTIAMLANEKLNHFATKNSLNYLLAVVLYPLFLLFQYTGMLMDFFVKPKIVFINYIILAKKII